MWQGGPSLGIPAQVFSDYSCQPWDPLPNGPQDILVESMGWRGRLWPTQQALGL